MRATIAAATAASLVFSQLASTAALAQAATRLPAEQPAARPAPTPGKPAVERPSFNRPPMTKPAPKPKPGFGGSGGNWQKPVPLPAPVPRPPRPRPPGNNWGGNSGGNWGGNWGGNGGGGGNWNDWYGRIVRCESWNYRYARCNLDTRGGVRLTRVIAGDCRQGRTWGWDTRQNFVWVNRGCRADFQARYGSWNGNNNNGPSAGAVIGGVAVAAGLIAILAASGRTAEPTSSSVQPAAINIAGGAVPAAAEQSFRLCTQEAARQIGATGGTGIRLLGAVETTPGNGGWRFQMPLESTFPGNTHATPAFCRATSTEVVELSFYQL